MKIVMVLLVFFCLVCVVIYGIIARMCSRAFSGRPDPNRGHYTYFYDHYAQHYPRREYVFPGTEGELHGFLYGEENTGPLVIVCHGIGAFHEDYMSSVIWFVDHGYRVFALDLTGSGASGGRGTAGLPQSALDVDAALSFLERDPEWKGVPKVLFGHSWGAYGVAAGLYFEHDVRAAVTVAGYNDPVQQLETVFVMMLGKAGKFSYPFLWLWHRSRFGKYGVLRATEGINRAGIPVLIVQGTEDQLNAADGTSIYAARGKITNPKVQYLVITKEHCADHLSPFFTDEANEDLCHMTEVLTEIAGKYKGKEKEEKERTYYESLNKDLMSRPNETFFAAIDSFYKKSI